MGVLVKDIEAFLDVGYGNGYGRGYGNGYGRGYGDGYGNGCGDGYGRGHGCGDGNGQGNGRGHGCGDGYGHGCGDGYGNGCGDGYGNGRGIKSINKQKVYEVDGLPSVITAVHGNYAKGYTIAHNVELVPCYIAKYGNYFAHADTLAQAQKEAREKYEENLPIEERISRFVAQYPTLDTKASASDLFVWHHILTGSCEFGRKEFCRNKGISWEDGEWSIKDFLDLTKAAYGSYIIKQVINKYK